MVVKLSNKVVTHPMINIISERIRLIMRLYDRREQYSFECLKAMSDLCSFLQYKSQKSLESIVEDYHKVKDKALTVARKQASTEFDQGTTQLEYRNKFALKVLTKSVELLMAEMYKGYFTQEFWTADGLDNLNPDTLQQQ